MDKKTYFLMITDSDDFSKIPYEPELSAMYKQIGCSYIEIVRPRGWDHVFIVDEEFLTKGDAVAHINIPASLLYGTPYHGNPICGTVLVCKENGADLEGLTDVEADRLMKSLPELINSEAGRYYKKIREDARR